MKLIGSMVCGALAIVLGTAGCDTEPAPAATAGAVRLVQPGAAFGERNAPAPSSETTAPSTEEEAKLGGFEVDVFPNGRQPAVVRAVRPRQAPPKIESRADNVAQLPGMKD
jgi:hypothetical protein